MMTNGPMSLHQIVNSRPVVGNVGQERTAKPIQPTLSEQDRAYLNQIFESLKATFPAWARAFPTPEALAEAKRQFTKAMAEAGITSSQQIAYGMQKARRQQMPFFPSPGQFISWCKPDPEDFGLPTLDQALMDVARHRSSHPAVVLAARATKWERQTLTAEEYRPVFEHAYEQLVRRIVAGDDLSCEVVKALPTREQIKHSPEYYQETGRLGVAMLRGVFRRNRQD